MTTSLSSVAGGAAAASLRVLVVDDHQTFADLLSLALSSEPDLDCVGTAGSAAEAVAMAAELKPDIVVMDIEMPVHRRGARGQGRARRGRVAAPADGRHLSPGPQRGGPPR